MPKFDQSGSGDEATLFIAALCWRDCPEPTGGAAGAGDAAGAEDKDSVLGLGAAEQLPNKILLSKMLANSERCPCLTLLSIG